MSNSNPAEANTETQGGQKIVWNDESLRASYANVVNVIGGREEIALLFGQSRNWKPGEAEVTVDLNHKMVLSPMSAKRLAFLLGNALAAYENAFGVIDIGLKSPPQP